MVLTRLKKAVGLIKDYGPQYFAKRTIWKINYRHHSDRHIYYDEWRELNKLTVSQAQKQREAYDNRGDFPLEFLVAVDTKGSTPEAVERTKKSLKHQTWLPKKVFSGSLPYVREKMALYLKDNSNALYWVLVIPAGDVLEADFFYGIADAIDKNTNAELIYTDREIWDGSEEQVKEHNVCLLPDYSMDYLCAYNYIGNAFVTPASSLGEMLEEILKPSYLRLLDIASRNNKIIHVDRLLYHEKQYDVQKKPAIDEALIDKAIRKAYENANAANMHYSLRNVDILPGPDNTRRVKLSWEQEPGVSVIIPNKDHISDLLLCLKSLQKQNIRERLEVLVVENNSTEDVTFAFYKWLETGEASPLLDELDIDDSLRAELVIKVLYWKEGFNYSAINNFAESQASHELILLLNNDVELIGEDAVEWLLSTICQENVGIVGAKLYYEDETVQHAGDIFGFGGVAEHLFKGIPMNDSGYMKQADCARRLTAVTAACLMVRRSTYEAVGGLETGYAVAFNDVDFCMKVNRYHEKIIYQPACEGWHAESKSRGQDLEGEKLKRFMQEVNLFRSTWEQELSVGDRYYNRNFSLMYNDGISYREPYAFDIKKKY